MSDWKRSHQYIIALVLFGLWLVGQAIFQIFVADSPRPAFYWLNAANLLQLLVSIVVGALLVITTTRRPKGTDLDHPPLTELDRATVDAFSLSTKELRQHEQQRTRPEDVNLEPSDLERPKKPRKHVVLDEDGEPYGRRASDISISDIKRLIKAVEQEQAQSREDSERRSQMAQEVQLAQANGRSPISAPPPASEEAP
jgi:hypothetical protein